MSKPAKIDRKQKIIQAALKCFIKKGVSQTTMSEVAQAAGVDQPLIHYYFPNTDALFADVVGVVLDGLKKVSVEALARTPGDPRKSLEAYVRSPFEWAAKNPGEASLWLYFYYLAGINPTFTTINSMIRETGRGRIAVAIYAGIEKGVFKAPNGMTVNDVAINVQGLMTGNTIMAVSEKHGNWKQFADETVAAVMAWLVSK